MALCAIKATPVSALPTATCGYVGDPKGGGTAPSTKRLTKNPALKAPDTGHQTRRNTAENRTPLRLTWWGAEGQLLRG